MGNKIKSNHCVDIRIASPIANVICMHIYCIVQKFDTEKLEHIHNFDEQDLEEYIVHTWLLTLILLWDYDLVLWV